MGPCSASRARRQTDSERTSEGERQTMAGSRRDAASPSSRRSTDWRVSALQRRLHLDLHRGERLAHRAAALGALGDLAERGLVDARHLCAYGEANAGDLE